MDRVDRAILGHLIREGRLSNTELADRVGLSPSPCLRRVRNLERAGVITGYHAAVDMTALGRGFEVLVHVEMAIQDRATLEAFYLRGRSLKQMSREFETPLGTIKRRLHVARNRLRRQLERPRSRAMVCAG